MSYGQKLAASEAVAVAPWATKVILLGAHAGSVYAGMFNQPDQFLHHDAFRWLQFVDLALQYVPAGLGGVVKPLWAWQAKDWPNATPNEIKKLAPDIIRLAACTAVGSSLGRCFALGSNAIFPDPPKKAALSEGLTNATIAVFNQISNTVHVVRGPKAVKDMAKELCEHWINDQDTKIGGGTSMMSIVGLLAQPSWPPTVNIVNGVGETAPEYIIPFVSVNQKAEKVESLTMSLTASEKWFTPVFMSDPNNKWAWQGTPLHFPDEYLGFARSICGQGPVGAEGVGKFSFWDGCAADGVPVNKKPMGKALPDNYVGIGTALYNASVLEKAKWLNGGNGPDAQQVADMRELRHYLHAFWLLSTVVLELSPPAFSWIPGTNLIQLAMQSPASQPFPAGSKILASQCGLTPNQAFTVLKACMPAKAGPTMAYALRNAQRTCIAWGGWLTCNQFIAQWNLDVSPLYTISFNSWIYAVAQVLVNNSLGADLAAKSPIPTAPIHCAWPLAADIATFGWDPASAIATARVRNAAKFVVAAQLATQKDPATNPFDLPTATVWLEKLAEDVDARLVQETIADHAYRLFDDVFEEIAGKFKLNQDAIAAALGLGAEDWETHVRAAIKGALVAFRYSNAGGLANSGPAALDLMTGPNALVASQLAEPK